MRFSAKDKRILKSQLEVLNKYASNKDLNQLPLNSKFTNKEEESDIQFEPINFHFLPGYPLIHYN